MQGHSASNIVPVAAANRVGEEWIIPCAENGNQSSSLKFYGSSFLTDSTGAVIKSMGRMEEGVICASYDLDLIRMERRNWGLFRDRRPEMYGTILSC